MNEQTPYKVDHDSEALSSYVYREGEIPICMCSWTCYGKEKDQAIADAEKIAFLLNMRIPRIVSPLEIIRDNIKELLDFFKQPVYCPDCKNILRQDRTDPSKFYCWYCQKPVKEVS